MDFLDCKLGAKKRKYNDRNYFTNGGCSFISAVVIFPVKKVKKSARKDSKKVKIYR